MKCFQNDEPGNKFIALYSDGSGCELCYRKNNRFIVLSETMGEINVTDVDWFEDAGYLWFIDLPDNFKLWGE